MTRSDDQRLEDLLETAVKLEILVAKGKENFLADFELYLLNKDLLNREVLFPENKFGNSTI